MGKGTLLGRNGEPSKARRARVIQKKSRAQEEGMAQDLRGRVQPGSGNGRWAKGDVKGQWHLGEAKTTDAQQYIMREADLRLIFARAAMAGRLSVFQVQFARVGRKYAVIPWDLFKELSGYEDGEVVVDGAAGRGDGAVPRGGAVGGDREAVDDQRGGRRGRVRYRVTR